MTDDHSNSNDLRRSERETIEAKERGGAPAERTPDSPTQLSGTSKKETLKRTFKEFSAADGTDKAAALTYYGIQALFPALIALVSVLGIIGPSATQPLIDNLKSAPIPGPAQDILTGTLTNLGKNQGAAGLTFVIGLLLALNSASSYISAFSRASNAIYEVEEGRPFWKLKPAQVGTTLVLIVLLVVVIVGIAVTGPIAEQVGNLIGAGSSFATVFDLAKIPVLLLVVAFMIAFLYWAAPNVKQPGFKFFSPGGVFALLVWIIASALFALYVATAANYNKTYGPLGGLIVFLIWLWITNIAIVLGAQFNAELQRSQQIEGGHEAPLDQPFLEPRDVSKLQK
jgi:membrane protein